MPLEHIIYVLFHKSVYTVIYLELAPKWCISFADKDTQIDDIWERVVPVNPVIGAHCIVGADVLV